MMAKKETDHLLVEMNETCNNKDSTPPTSRRGNIHPQWIVMLVVILSGLCLIVNMAWWNVRNQERGLTDNDHDASSVVKNTTVTNKVLVNGFVNHIQSESNPRGPLVWYCAPDSWQPVEGKQEGRNGKWFLNENQHLVVYPPAKKDYWQRTYYEPLLIKDDAPFLYYTLIRNQHYTIETQFHLTATRQFDQAGLFLRLDDQHWIKTGIEVVDQTPKLSSVVTNVYSDWSTQTWRHENTKEALPQDDSSKEVQVSARIRLHCRGTSFVVEAWMEQQQKWEFVRIAHLSSTDSFSTRNVESESTGPSRKTVWGGIFAASPQDQQGGHVVFETFIIRQGSVFEHNANSNSDS